MASDLTFFYNSNIYNVQYRRIPDQVPRTYEVTAGWSQGAFETTIYVLEDRVPFCQWAEHPSPHSAGIEAGLINAIGRAIETDERLNPGIVDVA